MMKTALPARPGLLAPLAMAFVACLATVGTAHADDQPGSNKALRRLQIEVARAHQEKAAVEADLTAKLESETKKGEQAQKQARGLSGEVAGLRRALAQEKAHAEALEKQSEQAQLEAKTAFADMVNQANQRIGEAEAEIAKLRERVAEGDAKNRKLEFTVQGLETDKTSLKTEVAERNDTISAYEKKNGELFGLNADLRKRYQDKGLLSLLKRGEPITGLSRVQEQNDMQAIEDKAYDARIQPGNR